MENIKSVLKLIPEKYPSNFTISNISFTGYMKFNRNIEDIIDKLPKEYVDNYNSNEDITTLRWGNHTIQIAKSNKKYVMSGVQSRNDLLRCNVKFQNMISEICKKDNIKGLSYDDLKLVRSVGVIKVEPEKIDIKKIDEAIENVIKTTDEEVVLEFEEFKMNIHKSGTIVVFGWNVFSLINEIYDLLKEELLS